MRVLYIVDKGNVGGAALCFADIIIQMQKLGVEAVVCNSAHNDLNDFLDNLGIENHSIGHEAAIQHFPGIRPIRMLKRFIAFLKYIKAREYAMSQINEIALDRIDIIHTNSARNDIGCYISRKYHIPHVVHIREFADLDFGCSVVNPQYYRMMNKYCARFIPVSNAVRSHWINKGLNPELFSTIYDGIHWQDIVESTDESKHNESLKMVITGGVFSMKGQHLAVNAMCLLPASIRGRFSLDIIGWYGESYVEGMKKMAEENGIADQVRFLGRRNDVHEVLGNYQIGLMCSRSEGFGRSTAEYMHARLGVIASDTGANPELIENEVSGLMFKSGDAVSLCDCLQRFYNDRKLLIRCSNNAQQKARTSYTDTLNVSNIFHVYQEVYNSDTDKRL